MDSSVVHSQQHVDILHGLSTHIGELLDLGGALLDLIIGQDELELLDTVLDCVPSSETVTDGDISGHTEVLGLEDLVGGGVGQDGLGAERRREM